jgi:hypothetical protein
LLPWLISDLLQQRKWIPTEQNNEQDEQNAADSATRQNGPAHPPSILDMLTCPPTTPAHAGAPF